MQSPTVVEQIGKAVETLADSLKVLAQELWRVLVLQAKAEMVENVIWGVVLAVASVVVFRAVWKIGKALFDGDDTVGPEIVPLFFIGAGAVFAFFIGVDFLAEAAKLAINPEYFAVKEILSALK